MRLARLCLLLLLALAVLVNIPHSPVVWFDRRFALWLHSHLTETRGALAESIIVFGNESAVVPLTLLVALLVAVRQRSILRPLAIVGAVALSGVVSLAMKWALPSPHPDLNLADQPALAHMFPSSHTAVVLTLLGVTAVVLAQAANLWIAMVGCAILASLMAFGLALGQFHWFSDIVGGALLAVAIVAATHDLLRPVGARQLSYR